MARSLAVALTLCAATAVSAGEVRGRVLAAGRPLLGASVAARAYETPLAAAQREARRQQPPKPLAMAVTAADGRFVLSLAADAGDVRLALSGPNAVASLSDVVIDGSLGEDVGDLHVNTTTKPLEGRVTDASGAPVAGANLTLWGRVASGAAEPQSEVTGADGRFRFGAASASGNHLRIERDGFASAELHDNLAGPLRSPIVLQPGRRLTGVVLLADGKQPAAAAVVRLEARGVTTRWVETGADGTFQVDGVPSGDAVLVAEAAERGQGRAAVSAIGPARIVLAPAGQIAGRVVDTRSGSGLIGVRISTRAASGGQPRIARFVAGGRYEIHGLPPGAYEVVADEAQHVPWRSPGVRVIAGARAELDVPLRPCARLSGRVVDEAGKPIEAADISLLAGDPASARSAMHRGSSGRTARSGPDGAFALTRLDPGSNFTLLARHDAYAAALVGGIDLPVGAAARPALVVLRAGRVLTGRVKDVSGAALAGVEIRLTQALSFHGSLGSVNAQMMMTGAADARPRRETAADGGFEFRNLAVGSYVLTASKPGFQRALVQPVKLDEAAPREPLELTLGPGAAIEGTVRDRAGNGAAGWRIVARPTAGNQAAGVQLDTPTGSEGEFALDGLVPGQAYDLQLLSAAGVGPRKSGVVAPAAGVDIRVPGKGRVRGVVVDSETGKPVADFDIGYDEPEEPEMRGFNRGIGHQRALHSDDGSFTIDDVPAGSWDVAAAAEGYQRARVAGIEVGDGADVAGVEIKLTRGGVLTGRVTDAKSGRPVPDASVETTLSGDGPGFKFGGPGDASGVRTDTEGRYRIAGLAAGNYLVKVSHPDYADGSSQATLREQLATADVKLGRGGAIAGTVVGPGGGPVVGAMVTSGAFGVRSGSRGPQAITDDAGRFRFDRITPGRYTLQAVVRGDTSSPQELVLLAGESREDVVLSLSAGATVKGHVTGLADALRGGLAIRGSGPQGYFANTTTSADGGFEIGGVPVGVLNLWASVGNISSRRNARVQVAIAEGQTEASVEIAFAAGVRVQGQVRRNGQPVPNAFVSATPAQAGSPFATGQCDETGSYVLEGLQEGVHDMRAEPMQGGAEATRQVTLQGDATVDLELPSGRIAGVVVDAITRQPLADVSVQAQSAGLGVGGATTDANGRFVLDGLASGPACIRSEPQLPAMRRSCCRS